MSVDAALLARARRLTDRRSDAEIVDAALRSLVVEAAYRAYDEHPLDEPDAWGDLASFRAAASST